MEETFDYEKFKAEALSRLENGEELSGKNGVLILKRNENVLF